jgi:hypothetical protein
VKAELYRESCEDTVKYGWKKPDAWEVWRVLQNLRVSKPWDIIIVDSRRLLHADILFWAAAEKSSKWSATATSSALVPAASQMSSRDLVQGWTLNLFPSDTRSSAAVPYIAST